MIITIGYIFLPAMNNMIHLQKSTQSEVTHFLLAAMTAWLARKFCPRSPFLNVSVYAEQQTEILFI